MRSCNSARVASTSASASVTNCPSSVLTSTIKHRFTGFSALDGSDGHTKLAVQAGFGEGFLAQAVLFAQRFEQTTVEQDPTIGKRRLSAGHGGKRKISGIHVDSPDRPVTLG